MLWNSRLSIAVFGGLLAVVAVASCAAAPKASESDSRARALAAVNALGLQNKGLTKAVVRSLPGQPESWEFSDEDAIVLVDGDTGQVRTILNRNATRTRMSEPNNMTEQRANQLAKDYLRTIGLLGPDAEIESSKPESDNPESAPNRWAVRFKRVYKGYPFYRNDFMRVTLTLSDGTLESLGANFRSPLPQSVKVSVARDTAVNAARDYLAKHKVQVRDATSTELMIVQPDNYWEYVDTGTTPPRPTTSRLAWVVRSDTSSGMAEVWMDAASGAALGGVRSRSISDSGKPAIGHH